MFDLKYLFMPTFDPICCLLCYITFVLANFICNLGIIVYAYVDVSGEMLDTRTLLIWPICEHMRSEILLHSSTQVNIRVYVVNKKKKHSLLLVSMN